MFCSGRLRPPDASKKPVVPGLAAVPEGGGGAELLFMFRFRCPPCWLLRRPLLIYSSFSASVQRPAASLAASSFVLGLLASQCSSLFDEIGVGAFGVAWDRRIEQHSW